MLVLDLMTPEPVTVTPETGIKEALTTLADLGITSMPVVDHHQRLCGIVSEADLIRDLVARDPRAQERPVIVEPLFPPETVEDVYTRSDDMIAADIDELLGSLGHADWFVEVENGVVAVAGPSGSAERSLAVVVARTVPGVVEVRVD